jgi:predicted DNA-binding transcriptional regulator AlpA
MSSTVTWLTVTQFCEQLGETQDTFQKWRDKGTTPASRRLPNVQLRFDARDVANWMDSPLVPA